VTPDDSWAATGKASGKGSGHADIANRVLVSDASNKTFDNSFCLVN
jgi:hypothetical protein